MGIPKPGEKVRGSYTGSPINAIFDLMGRRWALGIVWNLSEVPVTFRELQDRCGTISPTILNNRLKDLKEADIMRRTLEGYILTNRGLKLRETLVPLGDWSLQWADEIFNFHKEI
ncbi:MAG: helix-turn-helix transcriptional regulator [Spirochaetaceae bacterium]